MAVTVSLWLTHPDLGNDDCMTAEDFATEAEARAALADLDAYCGVAHSDCAFVEVDGPGGCEVIERPGVAARARREAARDAQLERSEAAVQAGMAFGVEAYNDAMGW
jgi:hypothetical protein